MILGSFFISVLILVINDRQFFCYFSEKTFKIHKISMRNKLFPTLFSHSNNKKPISGSQANFVINKIYNNFKKLIALFNCS